MASKTVVSFMERTQKAPAIQGHKLNVVKIKLFVLQTIPSAKWSSHHKGENTRKDTSRHPGHPEHNYSSVTNKIGIKVCM